MISPSVGRRGGWGEAFAAMAERGDDEPLWDEQATDWDKREWQW